MNSLVRKPSGCVGKDAVRAKSLVWGPSGGESVAEKQLVAELDELGGRPQPAQLDTVIVILGVEKGSIRQILIGKAPGMRVLLVEIADPGEKAARPQRKTGRQTGRLHKGLLDGYRVVGFDHERQIAKQIGVDIGLKVDLGLVDRGASRAWAGVSPRGNPRMK